MGISRVSHPQCNTSQEIWGLTKVSLKKALSSLYFLGGVALWYPQILHEMMRMIFIRTADGRNPKQPPGMYNAL